MTKLLLRKPTYYNNNEYGHVLQNVWLRKWKSKYVYLLRDVFETLPVTGSVEGAGRACRTLRIGWGSRIPWVCATYATNGRLYTQTMQFLFMQLDGKCLGIQ